jgi:hypothetical protein
VIPGQTRASTPNRIPAMPRRAASMK